jgi:hypothetical protein
MNPQQRISEIFLQILNLLIDLLVILQTTYFETNQFDVQQLRYFRDSIQYQERHSDWICDSSYSEFEESLVDLTECDQSVNNHCSVNDFLQSHPEINSHNFFSKHNDLKNTINTYVYPLNNGQCWICERTFTHNCCVGCKKLTDVCSCKFICGLGRSTGHRNKDGEYTQYEKCRYYTDGCNFDHQCIGHVINDHIVKFASKDSDSFKPFLATDEDFITWMENTSSVV